MKKIIFFVAAIMLSISMQAQLVLTSQPNGVVDVSYGPDFSLFDPQGATEIYIYMWVDPNQTNPNLPYQYNDDWGNASSLVTVSYNNSTGKFEGQIDFNTHDFIGEGVLPAGTQIIDFNLILRNQAGDRQTGNLLASTYGFTTTLHLNETELKHDFYLVQGKLVIKDNLLQHQPHVQVFDINGKLLYDFLAKQKETQLELKNNFYLISLGFGNIRIIKKCMAK